MEVFDVKTRQFFNEVLQPVEIVFYRIRPSQRKDYLMEPPSFLIIWMYDRLFEPFNLNTASTASSAKCCLSWFNSFELKVVFAMFNKSFLNFYWSVELSLEICVNFSLAAFLANLQPVIIVWGWILMWMSFYPSLSSYPARTATVVVPSPTSSSWVLEMSMRIFAAGLSTCMDLRIVAPSLVTLILVFLGPDEMGTKILSIPRGPSVVLTRSATAMAPTKDD